MAAPVSWRDAIDVPDAEQRKHILSRVSSVAAVEEALSEARSRTATSPKEALSYAEVACEMAGMVGDPKLHSAVARVRGQTLRALGNHEEAIDALEAAAQYALQAGDENLALKSRIGVVDSLRWLERFDEAISLAHDLEEQLALRGEVVEAARVLANEGNLYHRRDDYDAAEDAYTRSLAILRGKAGPELIAQVETNLANILTHKNKVQEAVRLYEGAREVFESHDDQYSVAVVDLNLGFLRYISGEHTAAVATFERSRKAFEAAGRTVEAAKVDGDVADVYRALNLLPEALECYDRGLLVFRRYQLAYEIGRSQIGRAVTLAGFGRYDEAIAALAEAEDIFREKRNSLQTGHVALIRAHVLRLSGRAEEAAREAEVAAEKLAAANLHGWAAEAAFIKHDVALEAGRDATEGMMEVAEQARTHLRSSLESRAHHSLGLYYIAQGETDRALEHLRAAVEALEHARTLVSIEEFHVAFLRDKLAIYEDLVAALLARGREEDIREALEYVERSKSRLLLDRVQSAHDAALRKNANIDPALAQRLADLRAELYKHYYSLDVLDGADHLHERVGVTVGDARRLREVEQAYLSARREAELALQGTSHGSRALGAVASAAELQADLGADETLVEYITFGGNISAFVISKKDVQVRLNIASVEEVERTARRLRFQLQRVESQASYVERHAEQLYNGIGSVLDDVYRLLLQPLESAITGDKLVIVPHSIVHGLPIHAARDGGEYALDRWEIVYSPGAAIWHAGVQRARMRRSTPANTIIKQQALLMGYPAPGIELVREEVQRLSEILANPLVFTGDDATVQAFAQHAPHSGVIHIATHALFRADNPLFSGLLFADGWLFAHDLYDYTLDCHLATLSACRTGAALVEPGDELFGLMRGFLAAGAQSLAVSLWPAADAATLAVMVRFYSNIASGMPRGAALRRAQRETREEYKHPYHWAAFALVGAR